MFLEQVAFVRRNFVSRRNLENKRAFILTESHMTFLVTITFTILNAHTLRPSHMSKFLLSQISS